MSRRIVPAEGWLTEHPRAVLAVRATLYLAAAAALLCLAGATVAFLGLLVTAAGVAALLDAGGGWLSGLVSVGGLGVTLCVAFSALVAVGVRRLDARIVAAATPPDPVERLKRRYVDADVDEAEFERRLERLLGADTGDPGVDAASASARSLAAARTESERA